MEKPPQPVQKAESSLADIEDYLYDEPQEVSGLFRKLPQGLWARHFPELERIDREHAGAGAETAVRMKTEYLSNILEARRAGVEEYKSDDPAFKEMPASELGPRLHELLDSPEGLLGAGRTAQVKRMYLPGDRAAAVKYLLTPLATTLSAEGEHDMLYEVDTITRIEAEEEKLHAGRRIRVPHPYFFYKDDRLQCYGMQEIKGLNLEQLLGAKASQNDATAAQRGAILKAVGERYANEEEKLELYRELQSFTEAMHQVCLHRDIKPANMMADEEGNIYLIDFGQSDGMKLMTDKTREQFENLQELEHQQLTAAVRSLLHAASAA
jgi:tRNA A-37 threonylcarbamoyl transferase component Bud32